MVPKAFEEKYIRLYSRFVDCSEAEHDCEFTEEDGKLMRHVLRSAFFAWANQEDNDARLVEPPTPARVSRSHTWAPGSCAASGMLERHGLSPMLEEQTAKRERQTPAKEGTRSSSVSGESGSGNTNAAKKRLKLK